MEVEGFQFIEVVGFVVDLLKEVPYEVPDVGGEARTLI